MSTSESLQRSTIDLLAGHLGHLTPTQEQAFSTFKDKLAKANLYTPLTDSAINGKASHDELTLLRFLRARRFDPVKAQKQFADAEKWRKEHDVDNLYSTFDPVEFESSKRFYPRWTGRRDKQGLPVYVYRLASLSGPIHEELEAVHPARRYQRIIALYEAMRGFVMPLCSHLPHSTGPTPISCVTTIIDLQGVSIGSMWSLRNHLQQASTLATANYPETLNTIAVVNSPSFFPTIWGWVKNWFDEGTRNKVHVLGNSPGETLRNLIDSKDLPKVYGGELDWKYEDEPDLDEDTRNCIGDMPKGPALFVDGAVVKLGKDQTPMQ